LYYYKSSNCNLYKLDEEKSVFSHKGHTLKNYEKIIFLKKEMRDYINEKVIKNKQSPLILMEMLNDKFKSDISYKTIVNYLSTANKNLFGTTTDEFNNLLKVLDEMKTSGLTLHFDYNFDAKTHEIKNMIFSSKYMIQRFEKFNDVMICDTTFGVNR